MKQHQFEWDEPEEGQLSFVVNRSWTSEDAEKLKSSEADGLNMNHAFGFDGDLSFLSEALNLRRIDLLDRSVQDLSPLERLAPTLEHLSIEAHPKAEIDLGAFPRLQSVAGHWSLLAPTLGSVTDMRRVITWRFSERDLRPFRDHFSIEQITLKEAPNLEALTGLDGKDELVKLWIQGAPRLSDTSEIRGLSRSLRELQFEDCASIGSLDDFAELRELRFLEVGECGEIESLSPIGSLNKLERFLAWGKATRIRDGDLSPLERLPALREVAMMPRREYQPSVEQLKAAVF